jgi:hypothetical protein
MSWGRLDDQLFLNRKLARLSPSAGWLWTRAISYACFYETEGKLPADSLPQIWLSASAAVRNKAASELVENGCWHQDPDGWVIHDFWKYNPPPRANKEDRQTQAVKAAHERWHIDGRTKDGCQFCDAEKDADEHALSIAGASSEHVLIDAPDPDPVPVSPR